MIMDSKYNIVLLCYLIGHKWERVVKITTEKKWILQRQEYSHCKRCGCKNPNPEFKS